MVKLFTSDVGAAWLLTELDPENQNIAFGLCDLGLGHPELGSVAIAEIEGICGPMGVPVERDLHFTPKQTLSEYAKAPRVAGRIVT